MSWIGAAIGGVTGLAGALFGNNGSGGSSTQSTSSAPWSAQQPYMEYGFNQAQNIYNNNMAAGPYTGEITADPNGYQGAAENYANQFANSEGNFLPNYVAGTATNLMGAEAPLLTSAGNMAQSGIPGMNSGLYSTLQGYGTGATTTAGPTSALSSALNSGAITGAQSLSSFNSGLQSAAQRAAIDPTSQITSDAAQYENNPAVTSAVNSTNAQIQQVLNEQTVPGLNREAAANGTLNSSRAGMAEAMANEGAGIAEGSADASILNNAYNTGVGAATNTYDTGLNSQISANSLGYNDANYSATGVGSLQQGLNEFNTNTALSAAEGGLGEGLQYSLGNANTELGADQLLEGSTSLGLNGAVSADNLATGNYNLLAGAGNLQQAGQQSYDTNSLQQWEMQNQYPQQMLNNYWGIVGSPVGTQSTTSGSSNLPPNYLGNAAAGGILGYQGYNSLFGGASSTGSSGYDPGLYGYSGDASSAGASTLQSLGLYNPIS